MMEKNKTALGELACLFLKLGVTAFGGPAAHIAMMEDEVVTRRKWIDSGHFLDMVGATNLIPGPNSTEMAIHIGLLRAGWRGAVVAGACFIIPAVTLTTCLAWLYVLSGSVPSMAPFFRGVKPAVIMIVLNALWRLGRKGIKTYSNCIVACVAVFLCIVGVNPLACLFFGGVLGLLLNVVNPAKHFLWLCVGLVNFGFMVVNGVSTCTGFIGSFFHSAALSAVQKTESVSLFKIMLFFLKVGAILYGSGYVLMAFIEEELVISNQWISSSQLVDAIAVGQLTPGPVLSTAAFIGFLLAGMSGAFIAAVSIFAPSFLFVGVLPLLIDRLRASKMTSAFLDGVNSSVVVIMGTVLCKLAWTLSWGWQAFCIAGISGVCVFKLKINNAVLILGAGILGLILWR